MNVSIKDLFIHQNKMVKEITLENEYIRVSFINIGAAITKFIDKKSNIDIVLGYKDYRQYLDNPYYLGAVVGRHAGRIENGVITLDNKKIQLTKNYLNKHFIHGCIHTKHFDEMIFEDGITFTTNSKDGEDGFPGNITLEVSYQLKDNRLIVLIKTKTDQLTLLNFTNHHYFNLSRDYDSDILSHRLKIHASKYILLNDEMIPKHEEFVSNTSFDFRKDKRIDKDLHMNAKQLLVAGGYDHPYLIDKEKELNHVASLESDELTLDIYSNQNCVVFYSGNFIDERISFNQKQAKKHCALCLETQGIPNSQNFKLYYQENIYHKDELYLNKTVYQLSNHQ